MSYIYSFEDFYDLWESEPLVIIDTNGFLNLYRYSPETNNHILKVLNTIPNNQFWIPAQALYEYNKNRSNVITREHSKYKEVTKEVERIMLIAKNDINKQFIKFNKFSFPKVKDLGDKIHNAIEVINIEAQNYKEEIKEEVKKNERMLKEDKVQLFVQQLIDDGRVGKPFNISQLLKLYNEGEQRYKYKIPPGYMDIEKDKKDLTKRDKFGDLILWKQLLNQARVCNKGIIFITQDEKEDWWLLDKEGNALSPREELFLEFSEYSDQPLVLMNLANFITHVSKINNMVDFTTHLEMNAEDFCEDMIEIAGWDIILDKNGQLTSYLIHGGDLQDFLENSLSDVEIVDFYKPSLSIDSVDISKNQVIIEGSFETRVEINITEAFSKNYSVDFSAPVLISGSISFEFEVDFEKKDDFINKDTLNIVVGGFDVLECDAYQEEEDYQEYEEDEDYHEYEEDGCVDCGDQDTSYFTKNGDPVCESCSNKYATCPKCGRLFEHGTIGAFCFKCERESMG